jgi:hypothetical protein
VVATIIERRECAQGNLKHGAIPRISEYDRSHRIHDVYGLPDSPLVIPRLHLDPLTGLDRVLSNSVDPRREGRVVEDERRPQKREEIVGRAIDVGETGRGKLLDDKSGLVSFAAKNILIG